MSRKFIAILTASVASLSIYGNTGVQSARDDGMNNPGYNTSMEDKQRGERGDADAELNAIKQELALYPTHVPWRPVPKFK